MPTLTSVTKHFITAQEGFTTTTAGSVASGAATVTLNSVSGYTNGDQVAFVIDPTDVTKKQVFTGTIDTSGVQVTNVVWTEGTNQTHAAGATVVDYTTATHQAAMVKGVKVSLDDDGTLKAGAVDNSAVIADGVVSTAKIADDAVTPEKRSGGFQFKEMDVSTTGAKTVTFDFEPKYLKIYSAFGSDNGREYSFQAGFNGTNSWYMSSASASSTSSSRAAVSSGTGLNCYFVTGGAIQALWTVSSMAISGNDFTYTVGSNSVGAKVIVEAYA